MPAAYRNQRFAAYSDEPRAVFSKNMRARGDVPVQTVTMVICHEGPRICSSAAPARKEGFPSKTRFSRFGWETTSLNPTKVILERVRAADESKDLHLPFLRCVPPRITCHLERP